MPQAIRALKGPFFMSADEPSDFKTLGLLQEKCPNIMRTSFGEKRRSVLLQLHVAMR